MKTKEEQLEKEIDRLKRRNKILNNRIKRLQEEVQRLSTELDLADALSEKLQPVEMHRYESNNYSCKKCGNMLNLLQEFENHTLWMCSSKSCVFTLKVAND